VILSEHLNRIDDAQIELNKALAANPAYVPAQLNVGNLHEDQGHTEAARAAYSEALRIAPSNGRAHGRLAAIDVFENKAADAAARLRSALARPGVTPEDRAEMLFALGGALDALGQYDEAFRAYQEGNALRRTMAPAGYDPQAAEALIDAIIAAFPAQDAPLGLAPSEPPIFICGMFRSGSTLAEQILARHSQVTAGGELEFMPALVAERLQPFPAAFAAASPESLAAFRDSYLESVRALYPDAKVVTDKRPDNFLYVGLIKTLFPQARIVHTVREPLDNLLSIYFLDFQDAVTYGLDLADAAHWYRQYRRLMAHWKSLYGADIHDFDYDRTVTAPEPELRALLEFCGLAWEDRVLEPADTTTVRTASVWQVRQPLHARSSGRWRNYAAYLDDVRQRLR
jgi:tetratricopeptide (TPR) repeat protein